ncbi:MAG: hypothetical protein PHZ26_04195 [Candidatus Gracilibacteria bacterium]|nr:hypothetical protein [Candidatus Gracilibacteria bacterium]MDD2908928.1 hypothetical protein [Candidatus Gracilibacteria bacterium]
MGNKPFSDNNSGIILKPEDLGLENFDGAEKPGWPKNYKPTQGIPDISRINSNIVERVENRISPEPKTCISADGENFLDWIDGNTKQKTEKKERRIVFDNFFDDEDGELELVIKPKINPKNITTQAKSTDVTIAKSHDELEKIMNELSGYTQNSSGIGSNADINNLEHIIHMSDTLPYIFDKLGDVSLCLKEEGVKNVFDKDDGSLATLGFIEHPDHFDIINPLTGNSEYSVTNVRQDGHYAVTRININDGLINVIFNIEINNSNKLSCIATNLGGQALKVYNENIEMSDNQKIEYEKLLKGRNKDEVFESFLFLLNSGYYTSNLDKIFTPKKACNK